MSHNDSQGPVPASMANSQTLLADKIDRLLGRLDEMEQIISRVKKLEESLPNLAAIAIDYIDTLARDASRQGIDLPQRMAGLSRLFLKLTEPGNLAIAEKLLDRLPLVEQGAALAQDLPNLMAMLGDIFDEFAKDLKSQGIDLEQSVRQGLHAALWLGAQLKEVDLERIGFLLRSDVLNEHSVETVGMAGAALASCRRGTCEHPVPKRIGLFGLLTALRDPNTQRAAAFGLQFAKCFGGVLDKNHPTSCELPVVK